MPNELATRRLEVFLKFVSACAAIRAYDPLLSLLAGHARGLIEFKRLTILLCDDKRRILRTVVIEDHTFCDVSPDEIQMSEMDLMLNALISGEASRSTVGICAPAVSAGRLIGVLCVAANHEPYSKPDVKVIQLLADYLAGIFDRLAQDNIRVIHPVKSATSPIDWREASAEISHAVSLRMSYLAQHDALTGLPNRWLLNDRLTRGLAMSNRYRRRLAVLFLDLDRFKEINDSLGHAVGDQVLQRTADRLVKCVRASDTVSRIGGDEFVVLLTELESDKMATVCASKIIAAVTAPLIIADHKLQITLSIGIGIYPRDGADAETLIQRADAAMYRAKAGGPGNCYVFKKSMDVPAAAARTAS